MSTVISAKDIKDLLAGGGDVKNLPAEAPNAQWRKYFPVGAELIGFFIGRFG
jgi:hypothetical protein